MFQYYYSRGQQAANVVVSNISMLRTSVLAILSDDHDHGGCIVRKYDSWLHSNLVIAFIMSYQIEDESSNPD